MKRRWRNAGGPTGISIFVLIVCCLFVAGAGAAQDQRCGLSPSSDIQDSGRREKLLQALVAKFGEKFGTVLPDDLGPLLQHGNIHWVGPDQGVAADVVARLERGEIFVHLGSFRQGQAWFYQVASMLGGEDRAIRAQMANVYGIAWLAKADISEEFGNSLAPSFRYADHLFWEREAISGKTYTIEHMHPHDAPEILALHHQMSSPELRMGIEQMEQWIQRNPRSLVARDAQRRVVGFIFISLLPIEQLPWSYGQIVRSHRFAPQARDTMVDFWVVGSREAPGVGKALPLITGKLADWLGGIDHIIAYSRPAHLEMCLIEDEFQAKREELRDKHGLGKDALISAMRDWLDKLLQEEIGVIGPHHRPEIEKLHKEFLQGASVRSCYRDYRKIQNRSGLEPRPRPAYEELFPSVKKDINRYVQEDYLFITYPEKSAVDEETGDPISYQEYLALLEKLPPRLQRYTGLDKTHASHAAFIAPRGVDAYKQHKLQNETVAQFARRTGRVVEAKVLIGVHQDNGAIPGGIVFAGRPEDIDSLGRNYLMVYRWRASGSLPIAGKGEFDSRVWETIFTAMSL